MLLLLLIFILVLGAYFLYILDKNQSEIDRIAQMESELRERESTELKKRKEEEEEENSRRKEEVARAANLRIELEKIVETIKPINSKLLKELRSSYLSMNRFNTLRLNYRWCYLEASKRKSDLSSKFPSLFRLYDDSSFRDEINAEFVRVSKDRFESFFLDLERKKNKSEWRKWKPVWLTEFQYDAVFSDEDATLVNAGAGTWKTKVIESKFVHLVNHQHVGIHKILVLTYSKKSREDMLERIAKTLEYSWITADTDILNNNISTFHSFWKKIIDSYFSKSISSDPSAQKLIWKWWNFLTVLDEDWKNRIIKESMRLILWNPNAQKLLQDFIINFDKPQIDPRNYETWNDYHIQAQKLYISHLKDFEGKYRVKVKSYGELLIANFLWAHWVRTEYEPKGHYYTDLQTGQKRAYKPDFYLPDHGVYIEYFGVDRHGMAAPYISTKDYSRRMEQKIAAHSISRNKFIDLRYAHLQDGVESLLKRLAEWLLTHGVEIHALNPAEFVVSNQTEEPLAGIEKKLSEFLGLYKESNETIVSLRRKASGYFDVLNRERNLAFLRIFELFSETYARISGEKRVMDFGDMISLASSVVNTGQVTPGYDYVLIDEFQDISKARLVLVKSVLKANPHCHLFCVWDDWQSIYQFAGSDSSIFPNFEAHFGHTKKITLDRSFRFNQWISDISSDFIMMNPEQSEKRLKALIKDRKGKMLIIQKDSEHTGYLAGIFSDMLADSPKENITVFLITRYWANKHWSIFSLIERYRVNGDANPAPSDPRVYEFNYTFEEWKERKITLTHYTSHKSKWLEADYVIVDDVNQWMRFDFPSAFENDPVMWLIVSDGNEWFMFAEERRLFYVSITRWKNKAYLVYEKDKESVFLKNLLKINEKYGHEILKVIADTKDEVSILRDRIAPKCSSCWWYLEKRRGLSGEFWGCKNYPQCTHTAPIFDKNSPNCPICESHMTIKTNSKTGEHFWWCSQYSEGCKWTRKRDSVIEP